MEIGNQYVNCATLKNKHGIREQGKLQIKKKNKKTKQKNKKQKTNQNKTKQNKGVSLDKREKTKSENME